MKRNIVVHSSKWFRRILLLVAIGGSFSLAMPLAAAADTESCSANSESRQLDFWLGDWTVTYPGMPGSAEAV